VRRSTTVAAQGLPASLQILLGEARGPATRTRRNLFLASDEAYYVNGQAIPVDGGLTASMPYAGKPI